jgi:hypothetical protein
LFHELRHSADKDLGKMDRSLDANDVRKSEVRAVQTENAYYDYVNLNTNRQTDYSGTPVTNYGDSNAP